MPNKTFRRGVHPLQREHHGKPLTEHGPLITALAPEEVVIPLLQSVGAPCEPCVAPGDAVLMGQTIAKPRTVMGAPVHSSISGTVTAIESRPHPNGSSVPAIIIKNDWRDEPANEDGIRLDWEHAEKAEILAAIRAAGIVGMGGAAFPTEVKLSPPEGKKIDTVLINGAECEPYLTADHYIMREEPERVVRGLLCCMKVLGTDSGIICVEANKRDAIEALQKAVEGKTGVRVLPLRVKYPQGSEKQLIEAATGRQVPSGGLPMDAGAVVVNAGTAAAIDRALTDGKPLYERIVTVSGEGVLRPANLLARVGTPVSNLIDQCGGIKPGVHKILSGGPMMGTALHNISVPVVKGMSGITVLVDDKTQAQTNCLRCGKCIEACPMGLAPGDLATLSDRDMLEAAEKRHILDCMECGACSFACPAKKFLTQSIRMGKRKILAARAAQRRK